MLEGPVGPKPVPERGLKWSLKLQRMCVGTGFGPTGPSKMYTKYLNIESSQ